MTYVRIRTSTDTGIPRLSRADLLSPPDRAVIASVYLFAVAVRLFVAFLFGDHTPQIVDAQDYDRLARGLIETGQYITPQGDLSSLRPPLYPVIVAGIFLVLGIGNYLAVALAQSAMSLATMLVTHRIGNLLFGPRAGLTAAAIVGVYPSLLAFNCLLLSETLFTLLFMTAVLSAFQIQVKPDFRWALLLGAALGFGALTRSILWVCGVPILGYLLLTSSGSLFRRFSVVVVAACVFVAILAPWAVRNTQVHKTFTVVDVMGGRNVMMGNYEFTPLERSWATISDVTGEKSWNYVLARATPDYGTLTQGQIDKRAMQYGVRYFFTHPSQSMHRCAVRFFNFWQLDRTIVAGANIGMWGEQSIYIVLILGAIFCGGYVLVIVPSIFGLIAAPVSWKTQGLALLWIGLPCLIHTAAFAHSRYHLPVIPLLAVYAAFAMNSVWESKSIAPIRRAIVPATILSIVLVCAWVRELVMVDLATFF